MDMRKYELFGGDYSLHEVRLDAVQYSNSGIVSRCFNHWLTAVRLEKCCHISHEHIHKVKDKVEEFLQKSTSSDFFKDKSRTIFPMSSDKNRRNQYLLTSSSKLTDSTSSSGSNSNRRAENVIVKIDNPKLEQLDLMTCCRRSIGSGKVIADLQKMRENRLKNLQLRNERRERIRMENLAHLREQTENAAKVIEEENRRMAHEAKERRNQWIDKFRRMETLKAKQKADRERGELFHRSLCLRYYGYLPWKNYVQQQRNNELHACRRHQLRIQGVHFLAWHRFILEISVRKQTMADICYARILSRRTIYAFSEAVNNRQNLIKKASEFYDKHLVKMCLLNWLNYHKEIQNETHHRNRRAINFFERTTKRKYFEQMRYFVSISRAEKERERRLANLRLKILDIVPDFQPCFSVE